MLIKSNIFKLPDNPYDAADKWLLKENLPFSYRQQIVEFILQNTGQKDFTLNTSFRDPYTGGECIGFWLFDPLYVIVLILASFSHD